MPNLKVILLWGKMIIFDVIDVIFYFSNCTLIFVQNGIGRSVAQLERVRVEGCWEILRN